MIAWNDYPEPLQDDSLLPPEDELDDLADDLGWSIDQEPTFEDKD